MMTMKMHAKSSPQSVWGEDEGEGINNPHPTFSPEGRRNKSMEYKLGMSGNADQVKPVAVPPTNHDRNMIN